MARLTLADEARLAELHALRARLADARHGEKSKLVEEAAQRLTCSVKKIWSELRELGATGERRRRADAGQSKVSDAEVMKVAGILSAAYRDNNKRLMSFSRAIAHARANGWLSVDCSVATLSRRMQELNVHPDQVERPQSHVNLRSDHPNHVWQIDPSLCVLYRLPDGRVRVTRADDELLYKNKPDTLEIVQSRNKLWRYVVWDHYSSAFFFRYFETPGESSGVLLDFLLEATRKRPRFLMHGWPKLIYWDKGSANTSAPIKNLFGHMGVRHQTHKARNARAKGGVEGCNNLIECGFESSLSFCAVPAIDELNGRADDWQIDCNAMEVCSRHGHTRWGLWQTIRPEQLILSPPEERLRRLANAEPVERKVKGDLTVAFDGKRFDVSHIESLSAGDPVQVFENAYLEGKVQVMARDAKGIDRFYECAPVEKDEAGFWSNAVRLGEEFRSAPARPGEKAREDLREMAWGTRDENEAVDARKKGRVAFEGQLDPFKVIEDRKKDLPQFIQRQGTAMGLVHPEVERLPLSVTDLLIGLRARLGRPIERHEAQAVQAWHPEGLPEDQFDALVQRVEQLNSAAVAPQPAAPRLVAVR